MFQGVFASTIGPTLLNLGEWMNTDLNHLSIALVAKGVGFLAGNLVVGLLLDAVNRELFFVLATGSLAVSGALAPSTGSVYGFIGCFVVAGAMGGVLMAGENITAGKLMGTSYFICPYATRLKWYRILNFHFNCSVWHCSGGAAYVLALWEGSKWQRATTQALHSTFSIGAIFGPLFAGPFLVELAEEEDLSDDHFNLSSILMYSTTEAFNQQRNVSANVETFVYATAESIKSSVNMSTPIDFSTVRYPYLINGALTLLCSMLFLAVAIKEQTSLITRTHPSKVHSDKKVTSCTEGLSRFSCIMIFLFFSCQFCHATVEIVPSSFLATFVVKQLEWSVKDGATISSLRFGCIVVGGLFGIPLSMVLSPTAMLSLSLPLTTGGFVFMCFVPSLPTAFTYVSVGFIAFVMASTTPSFYLWVSRYITITGRVAAIISSGIALADIMWQPIAAHLLQAVTPMFVVYIPLTASVIELLLFGLLNAIVKCCPVPQSEPDTTYTGVEMVDVQHPEKTGGDL